MTLPRRRFLNLATGAAAAATMPGGGVAFAQPAPAPRAKGPLVWLDMDQKELDDAYTQSVYAPNLQIILKRCTRNGELVRERIGAPMRFAYGPTAIEGLDVFPAKTPKAPVHVHDSWWCLARAACERLPLRGRDVRQCRCEFRRF
jgi:arylformamidase